VQTSSVARFISGLFLDTSTIHTGREDASSEDEDEEEDDPHDSITYHRRWKEVERLLPELVAAHVEEAYWLREAEIN
jgi:hypothetical protein